MALIQENENKPITPIDIQLKFQNSTYFMFTYKTKTKHIIYRDIHVNLKSNYKNSLLDLALALELNVNNTMKKGEILKVIMNSSNLHPLLKQYNDPTYVDEGILNTSHVNMYDARNKTVERILRDMVTS